MQIGQIARLATSGLLKLGDYRSYREIVDRITGANSWYSSVGSRHNTVERYGPDLPTNMPPKAKAKAKAQAKAAAKAAVRVLRKMRAPPPGRRILPNMRQKKNFVQQFAGVKSTRGVGAVTANSTLRTFVKFAAAPNMGGRDGLRVIFCVPIAKIGNDTSTVSGNGALYSNKPAFVKAYSLDCVNHNNYFHLGPTLLGQAFSRYRVTGLSFHYRRVQGNTGQSTGFIFAFDEDPFSPTVWADSTGSPAPTVATLANAMYQHEFAGYDNWDFPIPMDVGKELLFTYNNSTVDDATRRLISFGAMSCLQQYSNSTQTFYGKLYMTAILDLYDFTVNPTSYAPVPRAFRVQEVDEKGNPTSTSRETDSLNQSAVPVPVMTGTPMFSQMVTQNGQMAEVLSIPSEPSSPK